MTEKLTEDQVQTRLQELPEWKLKEDKLHFSHEFKDFKEAFAFMTRVADLAEEMNHHPEWFNCYNRVRIELVTHDADGISNKDFELAKKIDLVMADYA